MPTDEKIEAFLDAEADALDEIDQLIEKKLQSIPGTYRKLLTSTSGRDPEVFRYLGVDLNVVLKDYEVVPLNSRGPNWVAGLSALFAAVKLQAWVDAYGTKALSKFSEEGRKVVAARKGLSKKQLVAAAVLGVEKTRIEKVKASKVPKDLKERDLTVDVPKARALTRAEILKSLEERGIISPVGILQTQGMAKASRFIDLQPGSPEWAREFQAASNAAKGDMIGLNYQVYQGYTTLESINGDETAPLVWVAVGDKNTCGNCSAKAGKIHPYIEWTRLGLPGAQTCLGKERCRCDLVPA